MKVESDDERILERKQSHLGFHCHVGRGELVGKRWAGKKVAEMKLKGVPPPPPATDVDLI